jgi:hypothetical protein
LGAAHARPDRDDLARGLVARHERQSDRRRIHAHAEIGVDVVHARSVLPNLDLALAGRADVDLLVGQDLGAAVLVHPDCCYHD